MRTLTGVRFGCRLLQKENTDGCRLLQKENTDGCTIWLWTIAKREPLDSYVQHILPDRHKTEHLNIYDGVWCVTETEDLDMCTMSEKETT